MFWLCLSSERSFSVLVLSKWVPGFRFDGIWKTCRSFFCEMLKTCSHVMWVLKLSCFDLSVVHLALSGSEVGGSARFATR